MKQNPELKLLPPIIPLVLYHGKGRWLIGERLSDIIGGDKEGLSLYLPDFAYVLYDFSPYSDREIKGNIMVRVWLYLFRHIFDPNLPDHLRKIFPLLGDLLSEDKTGLEFIENVLRYLINASDGVTAVELTKLTSELVSKESGGMAMSLASKLIEQGKKEGRKEGRQEEIIELLKIYLIARFDKAPLDMLERLKKKENIHELEKLVSSQRFINVGI